MPSRLRHETQKIGDDCCMGATIFTRPNIHHLADACAMIPSRTKVCSQIEVAQHLAYFFGSVNGTSIILCVLYWFRPDHIMRTLLMEPIFRNHMICCMVTCFSSAHFNIRHLSPVVSTAFDWDC